MTVVLQENRSTGYQWFVRSNSCGSNVDLMSDMYMSHPALEGDKDWAKRYGYSGERTMRFKTNEHLFA